MTTLLFTYGLPLLSALVAGALIGLEREWRGRAAGFRTHILVCLSSTLLMLASTSQGAWMFSVLPDQEVIADPTRMAHGILTGIGFLCAGVIFRAGFSIHGLTTAASLWTVSALGILFGAGLFWLGWGLVALATLLISHFELFGLKQAIDRWRNTPQQAPVFRTPWFYKVVRHPLYLGFLIAFWATPHMTAGHLLFAVGMTIYIFIGAYFEEKDLVVLFGERYRRYQQEVSMVLPLPKSSVAAQRKEHE